MKALEVLKSPIVEIGSESISNLHYNAVILLNTREKVSEAIAELEELMKPKSCAKCKAFKLDDEHNDGFGQCFFGIHFPNGNSSSYHKGIDFYCSEFEAKEQ